MAVSVKFQSDACLAAFIICLAALAGVGLPAFAQSLELDTVAAPVARAIQKKDKPRFGKSRVLVLDFVEAQGSVSQLGPSLADDFSAALGRRVKGFEVMGRTEATSLIRKGRISLSDLRDPATGVCMGEAAGATSVVMGLFDSASDAISLWVRVWRVGDQKKIFEQKVSVPRTSAMGMLLGEAAPSPSSQRLDSDVPAAGKNGVGKPRCIYCPNPTFSNEAVRAKVQGYVLLRVVVAADGHAGDVEVIKGAACGLNEKAIEAVKQWRFKPAIGPSGQPVAVQVPVEVAFRLLPGKTVRIK